MTDQQRDSEESIVELDAIDEAEWERDKHTPQVEDAQLSKLVKEASAGGRARRATSAPPPTPTKRTGPNVVPKAGASVGKTTGSTPSIIAARDAAATNATPARTPAKDGGSGPVPAPAKSAGSGPARIAPTAFANFERPEPVKPLPSLTKLITGESSSRTTVTSATSTTPSASSSSQRIPVSPASSSSSARIPVLPASPSSSERVSVSPAVGASESSSRTAIPAPTGDAPSTGTSTPARVPTNDASQGSGRLPLPAPHPNLRTAPPSRPTTTQPHVVSRSGRFSFAAPDLADDLSVPIAEASPDAPSEHDMMTRVAPPPAFARTATSDDDSVHDAMTRVAPPPAMARTSTNQDDAVHEALTRVARPSALARTPTSEPASEVSPLDAPAGARDADAAIAVAAATTTTRSSSARAATGTEAGIDRPSEEPIIAASGTRGAIAAFAKNKRNVALVASGVLVVVVAIVLASGGSDDAKTSSTAPPTTPGANTRVATADTTPSTTSPSTTASSTASSGTAAPTSAAASDEPSAAAQDAGEPSTTAPAPAPPAIASTKPDEKRRVRPSPSPSPSTSTPTPTLGGKQVVIEYDTQAREPRPAADTPRSDQAAISKARAYYAAGHTRLSAGDADGAIQNYRQALAHYPGYVAGYRGLGLAYARKGDKTNALKALKTYLGAAPQAKDAAQIRKRVQSLSAK